MAIPTFVWVAAITLQGIGMGLNAYSTSKAANRKREKTEQELIAREQFDRRKARAARRGSSQGRTEGMTSIVHGLAQRERDRKARDRKQTLEGAATEASQALTQGKAEQVKQSTKREASSNTIKDRLLRGGAG